MTGTVVEHLGNAARRRDLAGRCDRAGAVPRAGRCRLRGAPPRPGRRGRDGPSRGRRRRPGLSAGLSRVPGQPGRADLALAAQRVAQQVGDHPLELAADSGTLILTSPANTSSVPSRWPAARSARAGCRACRGSRWRSRRRRRTSSPRAGRSHRSPVTLIAISGAPVMAWVRVMTTSAPGAGAGDVDVVRQGALGLAHLLAERRVGQHGEDLGRRRGVAGDEIELHGSILSYARVGPTPTDRSAAGRRVGWTLLVHGPGSLARHNDVP